MKTRLINGVMIRGAVGSPIEYQALRAFISGGNTNIVIAVYNIGINNSVSKPNIVAGDVIFAQDKYKIAYDAGQDVDWYNKDKYDTYKGFWHNRRFIVSRVYQIGDNAANYNLSSGYSFWALDLGATFNLEPLYQPQTKTIYAPVYIQKAITETDTNTNTGGGNSGGSDEGQAQTSEEKVGILKENNTTKYIAFGGALLLVGTIIYFIFKKKR